MSLDRRICHRAVLARDARFDGRFFTAASSTGIYCRPNCPSRTPRLESCSFLPSAAAAEAAGFRPCLRCRPELAPRPEPWRGAAPAVSRWLALVDESLARPRSTRELAADCGVGEHEICRLVVEHLGASPERVIRTRRLHFAKMLISDTAMPLVRIARAAGYGDARRLAAAVSALWGRPPRELRRRAVVRAAEPGAVSLALHSAGACDWGALLRFLGARAIAGIEHVEGDRYRRSVAFAGEHGFIELGPGGGARAGLLARIVFPEPTALARIVARIRRVCDLDADVATIDAHLARDELLSPLVAARPGLRVAGGWSGFELAARAVLGQQITVAGARRLGARLVATFGDRLDADIVAATGGALTHVFPEPGRLVRAGTDVGAVLAMPRARAGALGAVARALDDDAGLLQATRTVDEEAARLRRLPGIGDWSAHYIAMRAMKESDAFPASDVVLLRAMQRLTGRRPDARELTARAEAWRPWRAYAATQLWAADAHSRERERRDRRETDDSLRGVTDRRHRARL